MLELIGSVLSSAVVAAFISMMTSNKEAKLQYVTRDRGSWRSELKDVTEKLAVCSCYDEECRKQLMRLKVRLNTYGKRVNEPYPENEYLYIMRDEHIWKEIDLLEKGGQDEFSLHRDKILDYISCLLKFDWERSKREATPQYRILLSIVLYCLNTGVILYIYFQGNGVDIRDITNLGLNFMILLCLMYMPLLCDQIKTNSRLSGIDYVAPWFVSLILGGILLLSLGIFHEILFRDMIWSIMFYFVIFVIVEYNVLVATDLRSDYENAVLKILDCKIYFYHSNRFWGIARYDSVFSKLAIKVQIVNCRENKLEYNKLIQEMSSERLKVAMKWKTKIIYSIRVKISKKEISRRQFLLQKSGRCKCIVKKDKEIFVGKEIKKLVQI